VRSFFRAHFISLFEIWRQGKTAGKKDTCGLKIKQMYHRKSRENAKEGKGERKKKGKGKRKHNICLCENPQRPMRIWRVAAADAHLESCSDSREMVNQKNHRTKN